MLFLNSSSNNFYQLILLSFFSLLIQFFIFVDNETKRRYTSLVWEVNTLQSFFILLFGCSVLKPAKQYVILIQTRTIKGQTCPPAKDAEGAEEVCSWEVISPVIFEISKTLYPDGYWFLLWHLEKQLFIFGHMTDCCDEPARLSSTKQTRSLTDFFSSRWKVMR